MAHTFCEHLVDYGAQYKATEAAYRQCVSLLDKLMSGGPDQSLVELVTAALQDWAVEDQKLRDLLVAEVKAGHVRVPSGIVHHEGPRAEKNRRRAKKRGHPICAACKFAVPRLAYPEWKFAHNGEVSFRGLELPLAAPANA
ncbi:MAG: hypothetical protein QNL91_03685 [Candidatus Krumholzibacteria bacterium]|nr:hypothetical protein [Candidatus Krumholzibacteria bacterium]